MIVFKLNIGEYDNFSYNPAKVDYEKIQLPRITSQTSKANSKINTLGSMQPLNTLYKFEKNKKQLLESIRPKFSKFQPLTQTHKGLNKNDLLDDYKINGRENSLMQKYGSKYTQKYQQSMNTDASGAQYQSAISLNQKNASEMQQQSFLQEQQSQIIQKQQNNSLQQQPPVNEKPGYMIQMHEQHMKRNKSQKETVQLTKCLILANQNSPLSFRIKNNITMGRHCTELLKVTKFNEFDYYLDQFSQDKIQNLDNNTKFKLQNPEKDFISFKNYLSSLKGVRYFQRLSGGVVPQHDPQEGFKFTNQKLLSNKPKNGILNKKRQNIYRNMSSGNILAAAVKSCKEEQLQKQLNLKDQQVELKPFFLTVNINNNITNAKNDSKTPLI